MASVGEAVIEDTHARLAGFAAQLRAALDVRSDAELWSRPNPEGNAAEDDQGTLAQASCSRTTSGLPAFCASDVSEA
jgi:hypothetical protein